jgi:hypothetical protein
MWWAVLLPLLVGLAERDPPATQSDSAVPRWLAQLASDDAFVRDAARKAMLGMTRAQLLELRQLVAEGEARLPSQRSALSEIVRHVYLATEPYPTTPEPVAFLGLSNGSGGQWRLVPVGEDVGLTFERRLLGFDAYRALEDGDVILGVEELPELRMEGQRPLDAVRHKFRPGTIIHLIVLRDDRIVRAELRLSPTPLWQSVPGLEELSRREMMADEYWNREFAPLFQTGPS